MKSEKQVRLLVCDPDPWSRNMIEELLKGSPIKTFFTSPTESIENTLAAYSPINAVVVDLSNPPRRSCYEMIAAVKRASPKAEVIFLSRLADEILWSQVLDMGAYDLLPKPPERRELLRTIFEVAERQDAA